MAVQVSLPVLLFAGDLARGSESKAGAASSGRGESGGESPSRLQLSGGTDADMAPPVGYQQHVLFPVLRSLWGLQIEDRVSRCVRDLQSFSDILPPSGIDKSCHGLGFWLGPL
jgi:hypothetical protein